MAALGRGETGVRGKLQERQRDTKLTLISPTEDLLVEYMADETRPKSNCSSQILLGSG